MDLFLIRDSAIALTPSDVILLLLWKRRDDERIIRREKLEPTSKKRRKRQVKERRQFTRGRAWWWIYSSSEIQRLPWHHLMWYCCCCEYGEMMKEGWERRKWDWDRQQGRERVQMGFSKEFARFINTPFSFFLKRTEARASWWMNWMQWGVRYEMLLHLRIYCLWDEGAMSHYGRRKRNWDKRSVNSFN